MMPTRADDCAINVLSFFLLFSSPNIEMLSLSTVLKGQVNLWKDCDRLHMDTRPSHWSVSGREGMN